MSFNLGERWRISSFRLAMMFVFLLTLSIMAMLTLIYWQSSVYIEHRIDRIIHTYADRFTHTPYAQLPADIAEAIRHDPRNINILGLFGEQRKIIAGNLSCLPQGLAPDGKITQIFHCGPAIPRNDFYASEQLARALSVRLSNGTQLVIGRDISELAEIRQILLDGLFVGGSLLLVLGLAGGFALSASSLRRVQVIRDTTARIKLGDLSLRLPMRGNNDELDMLSGTINSMLEEIERLLIEVKSVTNTIAHNLRTPLTRLRLLLYRAQQHAGEDLSRREVFHKTLLETDTLLARFNALLRIAEIQNNLRRTGFLIIDPSDVINQAVDLFLPLAEEKGLQLHVQLEKICQIYADPELLLEALCNLIENAIKFTPAGGSIHIVLSENRGVPQVEIIDTGRGIPITDRKLVFQRHYRGDWANSPEVGKNVGHGLGLSIVSAIIGLHGFKLVFKDCALGTHLILIFSPLSAS